MSDILINDSLKNINNSTIILNDKKLIEENKDLKNILEILFGKNYEKFLSEQQKSNTQLIIHLSQLLNNKNIFETIELLNKEQKNREKLFNELKNIKDSSSENDFKTMLEKAEEALIIFNYELYHKILEAYDEQVLEAKVKESAKINFLRAEELKNRFKYKEALTLYEKAINRDELNSLYITALGNTYSNKGDYLNAIKYLKKSLAINRTGIDRLETARSYNNLGGVYNENSQYSQAINCFKEGLNITLELTGEYCLDTFTFYNNMGLTYTNMDDNEKAISYFKKAIKITSKVIIRQGIPILYNNMGLAYFYENKYSLAIDSYNKALSIHLEQSLQNLQLTSTIYGNLGLVYTALEDYIKAETLTKKSLNINLDTVGQVHPSNISCYNQLGSIYQYQQNKDYELANKMFLKALNICQKTVGENHSLTAVTYNNIGSLYDKRKNYDEALAYTEKAYEIMKVIVDDKHKDFILIAESIKTLKRKINLTRNMYIKRS